MASSKQSSAISKLAREAHLEDSKAIAKFEYKDPAKEGFIYRQNDEDHDWQKLWFVLQDSMLYFCKEEKKYDALADAIDMKIFSIVTKTLDDDSLKENSFSVASNKKVIVLATDDADDKEDWLKKFNKIVLRARLLKS